MPERADGSVRWILQRTAKAALAGALTAAGMHHAVGLLRRRRAGGRRVLILSYHRVTQDFAADAREGLASLLVSVDTLRRQLELVGRSRELVSLADALRILDEPPGAGRGDVAAVTFDDGYAEVVEHAFPVLARLQIPFSVFVPTSLVGTEHRLPHDRLHGCLRELALRGIAYERAGLPGQLQLLLSACAERGPAATLDRLISRLPHDRLLAIADALERRLGRAEQDLPDGTRLVRWEHLQELQAAGVDVGGHTMTHAALGNLSLAEVRREVEGCRDQLANRLGARPRHFAYPNGHHSPAVREIVARAGFAAAVTIDDEENRHGGDRFSVKRKVLWENTTLGPVGWSRSVATCNINDVFTTLRLSRPVLGERPDPVPEPAQAGERVAG